jgi:hypothetical protein
MGTTFIERQQKQLLKKFYALLNRAGVGPEGKEAILYGYGVESSRDLSAKDLLDVCNKLEMEANPALKELDVWRKRVIAAVFGYFDATGRKVDMATVKAVACRAARHDSFNGIPVQRLVSLYNAFKDKRKDVEAVNRMDLLDNINLN